MPSMLVTESGITCDPNMAWKIIQGCVRAADQHTPSVNNTNVGCAEFEIGFTADGGYLSYVSKRKQKIV